MRNPVYHRDLVDRFVGREVIWQDENNYSVGPGTVIGVTRDNKLRIINHITLMYVERWALIDQVEVVQFDDVAYERLPAILRDEITYATSYGTLCSAVVPEQCTNHRVFGGEFCAEHEVLVSEPEYDPRENYFWDGATR
jgi:hypothetical protein